MIGQGKDFAIFGGSPAFPDPLRFGQRNLPDWGRVEASFLGIFERQYYANNGPLVRALDAALARRLRVGHAVVVTNGAVALMALAKGLELKGEIVVPALVPALTVQALIWAGLEPVACDVDAESGLISAAAAAAAITPRTEAIASVRLWGETSEPPGLAALAQDKGLALVYDAAQAFGSARDGRPIGSGGAGETFSFHEEHILNAAEGGCVVTDDSALADRLRTIRAFHASPIPVAQRLNGKMSEAQAALALLSLEHLERHIAANMARRETYRRGLDGIPGIRLRAGGPGAGNNAECIGIDLDPAVTGIDAEDCVRVLAAEGIECRRPLIPRLLLGNRSEGRFAVAERLGRCRLLLPNGQAVDDRQIATICRLIHVIMRDASRIRRELRQRA